MNIVHDSLERLARILRCQKLHTACSELAELISCMFPTPAWMENVRMNPCVTFVVVDLSMTVYRLFELGAKQHHLYRVARRESM